jgi:hypothetical protein
MASLKSFFPVLGPIIGMSADELYNRQRALVAAGALQTLHGRGPGSGIHLSEDSVAILLIGLLSVRSLAETDHRIKWICDATYVPSYFTKERDLSAKFPTFRDAVSASLSDRLRNVDLISVSTWASAKIKRSKGRPRELEYQVSSKLDKSHSAVFEDGGRSISAVHIDRIRFALLDFLRPEPKR